MVGELHLEAQKRPSVGVHDTPDEWLPALHARFPSASDGAPTVCHWRVVLPRSDLKHKGSVSGKTHLSAERGIEGRFQESRQGVAGLLKCSSAVVPAVLLCALV